MEELRRRAILYAASDEGLDLDPDLVWNIYLDYIDGGDAVLVELYPQEEVILDGPRFKLSAATGQRLPD